MYFMYYFFQEWNILFKNQIISGEDYLKNAILVVRSVALFTEIMPRASVLGKGYYSESISAN